MPEVKFRNGILEDYVEWQSRDRKTLKRLNRLILDLQRDPFHGVGKFEKLKHKPGFYSRRIDDQNRLVYSVDEKTNTVTIESCIGHYDE